MGFTDVDATDTAALEKAIKGMGALRGLAYCVGSIALKPLKATTTDDFVKVRACVALISSEKNLIDPPAIIRRLGRPSTP